MKVITASGAGLCLSSVWAGCNKTEDVACLPAAPASTDPFDVWEPANPSDDIRLTTLSYALLAPNPHNRQQWFVELRGELEYDVFIEPSRALPQTDPLFRQLHVGLGCFLELAQIAARSFGHTAELEYFPEGEYASDVLENLPVARVRLRQDSSVEADPLFSAILDRRSSGEVFDGSALAAGTESAIRSEISRPGMSLLFGESPDFLTDMANFIVDAFTVEVDHPQRDRETVTTWRFTDAELLEHRDGTDYRWLGNMGVSAELILDPSWPGGPGFLQGAIDNQAGLARSAAGFGILVSDSNTRTAQLDAGRTYVRFNLRATANGIAMSPFSQVLQEYADMATLQTEFLAYLGLGENQTAQMLFRLGYSSGPSPITPRRSVRDVSAC